MLFLGDSVTQAEAVSTGHAYFDFFARDSPYRVYAAGAIGYGNLQQFLTLERVAQEVEPDIIFWQMCENDPRNDIFELGSSTIETTYRTRPYWNLVDGSVTHRDPAQWPFRVSPLFRALFGRFFVVDAKLNLGLVKAWDESLALPPSEQARLTKLGHNALSVMLIRTRPLLPDARVIGFQGCE